MSFNYKNPISPLTILGNLTVTRTDVFGTNFSVLGTGGYMEVYTLNDLYYTIPSGATGLIEYSSNTIPIQFNKGIGTVFSPDVLTLNSDNISSGRRRIGMLVYVIDDDQIYQYQIPNFESLWSGATGATGPGGPTVVFSEFGTTVKNNTPEGVSFISAWTANTIEGISGETALTAVWKKLETGGEFTGGTVTGATIFTNGLTANTFSASTYLGLPADIFITGGTFDNNTDTLTLERSSGSSIVVTGFTDYYTTGATLFGQTVFFDRNDALSAYSVNLSAFSPTLDVHVTGATYDNANTFTFTNNTGGTFDVSFDIVTGLTINGNLNVTGNTIFDNITATTISASTYQNLPIDPDTYITAFTYSSNTLTIFDNSGNTFSTTINDFTGLTINGDLNVTGDTILNNLTANTISATTYQNLPIDPDTYITAFTYSSNTLTIDDNSGNTFNTTINDFTGLTINGDLSVTGNTNVQGITATTISATTYQGLPIDPDTYVTAFTYNNNTFTIEDNSGTTFNATINDVTGLTINGDLTVTGNTSLQGLTATTISATTYQNLPTDVRVTGGTYSDGIYEFTNNTGGTFNVSATTTYSAGVISGATWSDTGSGGINLPEVKVALFTNTENLEPIYTYIVPSGTTGVGGIPSLTDNDTNYIVIDYNSGTPQYDVLLTDATINDSDIVLFLIVYRAGNFVHVLEFGNQGAGLPNKINDRIIMTDRFARESGFSLGLSGSTGIVTLSGGVSWNGTYRQSLPPLNSQDDIFFQSFHTGGTWTYTTTADTLNNLYYDDGTNPVLSSVGKFLVNWYFRGQEVNDHIYEVWGNDEYDSLSEAQLSLEPNLPELITSHAFLVGRIIVEYSATTGSVESAFVTYFQGSQVQAHNDLTGIQGGSAGQYYHLTSTQYLNLPYLNTNNVFQSGITATTISATTYQGLPIDIRVTGGTYTAGTATFTNNTGGTFTVTGFTAQDTFTTAFTYSNNTFTIFRNQGQPDLTATINTMTGLTVNGNLIVTGNTNVQALTGTSAYLSGSGQNILTIVGSGSSTSSPLMVVSGSSGELFSITDSLVGTLFSVNNVSGNPILSVDSSDIILMGNYLSPSLNSTIKVSASTGTTNIYSIPTSAYTGAFFDYTVNDGTNLRAGNIMSIWSGSTIQYSETSTTDIGNTSGITFNLTISSGNAILRTSGTTSGWTVKTIIRSI